MMGGPPGNSAALAVCLHRGNQLVSLSDKPNGGGQGGAAHTRRPREAPQEGFMARIAITALVAIHLAATLWHGDAHTGLAINLPPEKNIFVLVVILAAPIVAAGLVWTRYSSIGLWCSLFRWSGHSCSAFIITM